MLRDKTKKLMQKLQKSKPANWIRKEERRTIYEAKTGRVKVRLSMREALAITILSLISVFISAYVKIIYIFRFAHFENNAVMNTWHAYGAPLMIISILLFVFCCLRKGVTYWLVYAVSIMGLIYFVVEGLLVHNIVDINVLAEFFKSMGLWDLPEWFIGPGV